jgi:penicillin-binding protein 1A
MDIALVKIFATALALSQVAIQPDAVKTHFDPVADQAEVVQLLRNGCTYMRKAFNIENIDLDGLIATAMTDQRRTAGEIKAFKGIIFDDLYAAYRQFCKNEDLANSPFNAAEVINFYNKAVGNLPDHTKLKGMRLPNVSFVSDVQGKKYAELFEPDNRRVWVPLSDIPPHVRAAFISAEDKRFYQHHGVDERSVIRAFVGMMGASSKRQGGSTITQQLVKNLLVGDDVTYERKIREIVVASRVERTLTKDEILEMYLNSIFLGRGSWGVEMASRSYFGKSVKNLSVAEGAMLAGLAKGPNAYSPEKNPERARERLAYVLSRMQEDNAIDSKKMREALARNVSVIPFERTRRDTGYYFIDQIAREAKAISGIENLTSASYTVRSTIRPDLQQAAEIALQDGLARYERNTQRTTFTGAETNVANAVRRLGPSLDASRPPWLRALETAHLPLYDVHWTSAVVIEDPRKRGGAVRVGLRDGSVMPLSINPADRRKLNLYDVIYVNVVEGKGRDGSPVAELRTRPTVQGAVVVIENTTGRVLAMVGGFSFPLSQVNRVTQTRRQPGSSIKPLTYLAALNSGLQPNTLVRDASITLPPINKSANHRYVYARDYWTPHNYDGGSSGIMTLRRGLENSKNMVTARLLAGGIEAKPEDSLDRVCVLAVEMQIYSECVRYYPFVLGAQPVRVLDLATFYAAVANEGAHSTPYTIDSIEQDGRTIYSRSPESPTQLKSADRPAFYQLKSILQGVVARGTARSMSELSPYIGGKTGTSDNWNDAWFMGFTNEVTIGVWVGYDNADGKRRTLGSGQTGSQVAIPIFKPILQAVWDKYAPQTVMRGPSPEAERQLVGVPININSGQRVSDNSTNAFVEYFRRDEFGKVAETQHRLVAGGYDDSASDSYAMYQDDRRGRYRAEPAFDPFGLFGRIFRPQVSQPREDYARPRARRVDQDFFSLFR